MSLETLLEAAKYVEYQTEAKARGEEPHDYNTFYKLSLANKDGNYSYVGPITLPKKQQTLSNSNSSHLSEETKEKRRSLAPLVKDSVQPHEHSGTGTREVHNKLEKNRRAHLKECFDTLKRSLPHMDDRKTSNLSILRNAIRFITTLRKKEREYEKSMEELAREKIAHQQKISSLKKEMSSQADHIDMNHFIPEDDNETTTTASECGVLSDFDDNGPNDTSTLNSAGTSDFASSSSSSTASSVLVGPVSTTSSSASSLALSKPAISGVQISTLGKEPVTSSNQFVHESRFVPENKASLLSSIPSLSAHISNAEGVPAQTTRVFSAGNLHTMAGIFAAPHAMQVITQPSGIKVITTPNSIMASNSSVQHISVNHHQHGQIHVLTPSSNASFSSIAVSSAKPFCADSLVQVASGGAKGISKPHMVSPLALVSPQMVEISHGNSGKSLSNSTNFADLITSSGITNSLNLSQGAIKGNSVLSGNIGIAVKNNLSNNGIPTSSQSNMIATLHVSKPHSHVIQQSLAPSIITQGGSQMNNGIHHGVGLKPLASTSVRLPPITGLAHVVSPPISSPVGQIVTPGNHVSAVAPLVGSVSVVSHTGAVHQQSIGKVLKSVNQIPFIPQQLVQHVSVCSSNQPIVKPVVVVSMPNVVSSANMSLTPTSLVSMSEQSGVGRRTQN